jgi:hypothetical protein
MSLRRTGDSNFYFVWRRQIQHGDRPGFLSHFKGDPSAMRDLRAILEESSLGVSLARLTDDQVMAAISRLLGSGELMIAAGLPMHGGSATQAADNSQPDAPASSPGAASSQGQASDPATFPQDLNAAAQAAALSQAAASGAALCPT